MYVSFRSTQTEKIIDVQSVLKIGENGIIIGKQSSTFVFKLEIR